MRTVDTQVGPEGSLVQLIEVLQEIDTSAPDAKLNEESIDDGNGGRIIL